MSSSVGISLTLLVAKIQLSLGLMNQAHYKDIQESETTASTVPRDPIRLGFPAPVPLKPDRDAIITDLSKKKSFIQKIHICDSVRIY